MIDERLTLAAALYDPCEWAADIGTDHAHLPCHLLRTGVCRRMIAADVSPGALQNARDNLTRAGLLDRAVLTLADGLDALDQQPCSVVSIMGMGGKTLSDILRRGSNKLHGAVLVLSAHTELPLVRQAIADIGYHIVREELCRAAGRFYVFWRAEPGAMPLSEEALRYGSLLWESAHPELPAYAAWRMRVAQDRLNGLRAAAVPDTVAIAAMEQEVRFFQSKTEVSPC